MRREPCLPHRVAVCAGQRRDVRRERRNGHERWQRQLDTGNVGSLGKYGRPRLQWRDLDGGLHSQTEQLAPGAHSLMLTSDVQEVPGR